MEKSGTVFHREILLTPGPSNLKSRLHLKSVTTPAPREENRPQPWFKAPATGVVVDVLTSVYLHGSGVSASCNPIEITNS